jgi:hypothetical protein
VAEQYKQDGQCTINVTLMGDRATTVVVEKATNFTYSQCVLVVLGIQNARRMRYMANGGLSGSTVFFHIIS